LLLFSISLSGTLWRNIAPSALENKNMLVEERHFRICEILAQQRTVSAAELKKTLMVTAATIRRDLAALEQEGLLVRSHGGAVSKSSSTNFQPSYEALGRTNHEEKQLIAQAAAKLILDGDTVFLEGSTSVYELALLLLQRNRLTVVTNSPLIVCQLQRAANINVMCTGGDLQRDIFYLSGLWAQRSLNEIRVDKAVLGVSAIDPAYGISTASQAEASIKKLIVKVARERIGLADHSKFGNQGFAYVGPSTDINTLITDSSTEERHIYALRDSGVQVIVAGETATPDIQKSSGRTHPRAR
jgi:DeoR/GlpR family transcriptional regulator of sugar metabolism